MTIPTKNQTGKIGKIKEIPPKVEKKFA